MTPEDNVAQHIYHLKQKMERLSISHTKKMDVLRAELKSWEKKCDHPLVTRKSRTVEGSYYDRSYTEYWNECEVCGAKSEVTTTYGYYS